MAANHSYLNDLLGLQQDDDDLIQLQTPDLSRASSIALANRAGTLYGYLHCSKY